MILSLSYSIHVVSEFLEAAGEGEDGQSPGAAPLQRVFLPVVLTGLTTATGLLSLTLSPLAANRKKPLEREYGKPAGSIDLRNGSPKCPVDD